jgi:hypothetical protein
MTILDIVKIVLSFLVENYLLVPWIEMLKSGFYRLEGWLIIALNWVLQHFSYFIRNSYIVFAHTWVRSLIVKVNHKRLNVIKGIILNARKNFDLLVILHNHLTWWTLWAGGVILPRSRGQRMALFSIESFSFSKFRAEWVLKPFFLNSVKIILQFLELSNVFLDFHSANVLRRLCVDFIFQFLQRYHGIGV